MKNKRLRKFESFGKTNPNNKRKRKVNENYSPTINTSNLDYNLLHDVLMQHVEALSDLALSPSGFISEWGSVQDKSEAAWQDWMDGAGISYMTPQQVYVLLSGLASGDIKVHYAGDGNGPFLVDKARSYVDAMHDDYTLVIIVTKDRIYWSLDY